VLAEGISLPHAALADPSRVSGHVVYRRPDEYIVQHANESYCLYELVRRVQDCPANCTYQHGFRERVEVVDLYANQTIRA